MSKSVAQLEPIISEPAPINALPSWTPQTHYNYAEF
jgi:hypothetical protein